MTEQKLDSKRDLDNRLKKLCEQLISTCTATLASPLTVFLSKAEVILQMNREENVKPIVLKNQPFAVPEKVRNTLAFPCNGVITILFLNPRKCFVMNSCVHELFY